MLNSKLLQHSYARARTITGDHAFLTAFSGIVDKLDRSESLKEHVKTLALLCAACGAEWYHFSRIGDMLVATLAECLGPEWTQECEDEWRKVCGIVTLIALTGVREDKQHRSHLTARGHAGMMDRKYAVRSRAFYASTATES